MGSLLGACCGGGGVGGAGDQKKKKAESLTSHKELLPCVPIIPVSLTDER